jgi:hypothetical protein
MVTLMRFTGLVASGGFFMPSMFGSELPLKRGSMSPRGLIEFQHIPCGLPVCREPVQLRRFA